MGGGFRPYGVAVIAWLAFAFGLAEIPEKFHTAVSDNRSAGPGYDPRAG